jgi:uncharacterized protein YpiB (UPF0302 family)|tara:strand:- start:2242 stop:3000 length:759 start_codon:yes stop_codon:yes gene_type:complete
MKFIRISINESRALLTRVCESHYKHQYDYEDIATIVQWLELHNLDGIKTLLDEISISAQSINTLIESKEEQKKRLILNNNSQNILHKIRIFSDLTLAKCHEDGLCFTTVNNIIQQQAILVNLNSVSARGFYATAWWMEAKEKYLHIAKISPNQAYPIYKIIKLSKYASNPQSYLNLIYSKNDIESLKLYTDEHDSKGDLIVQKIDARDFNSYLHRKINNGLEIRQDHYQQLNKIADQILVASSEKSREGAGE